MFLLAMSVLALFPLFPLFAVTTFDWKNITAKPGDNVTLPCQVPSNTNIWAINWSRPDLGEKYVFFYRDGQPDLDNQYPSYEDRVMLKDKNMTGGDVSVILKNVTEYDTAAVFQCQVRESGQWKTVANISINLCTGHTDGASCSGGLTGGGHQHVALIAVLAITGAVFVGFGIFMRVKQPRLPPGEAQFNQLV